MSRLEAFMALIMMVIGIFYILAIPLGLAISLFNIDESLLSTIGAIAGLVVAIYLVFKLLDNPKTSELTKIGLGILAFIVILMKVFY